MSSFPTSSSSPSSPSSPLLSPQTKQRTIPFPSGTYTFLPQVEACDNFILPTGPWKAKDCKLRLERWLDDEREEKLDKMLAGMDGNMSSGVHTSSALDDTDDEEDVEESGGKKDEFIVPFFLKLPSYTPSRSNSSQPTSRRSSSSAATKPIFRLTPLPTLRPSSPTESPSQATSSVPTSANSPTTSSSSSSNQPIGFLVPSIIKALIKDNETMLKMNLKPVWSFLPEIITKTPVATVPSSRRSSYTLSRNGSRRGSVTAANAVVNGSHSNELPGTPSSISEGQDFVLKDVLEGLKLEDRNGTGNKSMIDHKSLLAEEKDKIKKIWAVGFADWVEDESEDVVDVRREHLERVVRGWKMSGQFSSALGGWRDESYSIYGPSTESSGPLPGSNLAFSLERAACALFGVATYGVHCTAYTESDEGEIKIWVPRRSATKQTWPSYLDNTVAGGITSGDLPLESIIRECEEEASLPSEFVSNSIKSVSILSYTYKTPEGWIQPEVQYVYDLKLPSDDSIVPGINDGEVEGFEQMGIDEIVEKMVAGEFKPNCALVLIDFFARHGFLTPENDSKYLEVVTRLRHPLVLPGPA